MAYKRKKYLWLLLIPLPLVLLGIANLTYISLSEPQTDRTLIVGEDTVQSTKPDVNELHGLTNAERGKFGVNLLTLDPKLNQSAQLKADDMMAEGYFGHINPKTGKQGYSYITDVTNECDWYSENIVESLNSPDAVKWWMNSESHRAALLDMRYEKVGYGISKGPQFYNIVQHFCGIM